MTKHNRYEGTIPLVDSILFSSMQDEIKHAMFAEIKQNTNTGLEHSIAASAAMIHALFKKE